MPFWTPSFIKSHAVNFERSVPIAGLLYKPGTSKGGLSMEKGRALESLRDRAEAVTGSHRLKSC